MLTHQMHKSQLPWQVNNDRQIKTEISILGLNHNYVDTDTISVEAAQKYPKTYTIRKLINIYIRNKTMPCRHKL